MFSYFKLALKFGVSFIIIINLITRSEYYSYCKLSEYKKDLFSSSYRSIRFRYLCNEFFNDFSNHFLLRFMFNIIHEMIEPKQVFEEMSDREIFLVIEKIEESYNENLKYYLKFFKFTNFIFYIIILYLIFVVFIKVMTLILKKCMILIFLYFVVEGFLNLYTTYNLDALGLIWAILNDSPMKAFGNLSKNFSSFLEQILFINFIMVVINLLYFFYKDF